MMRAVDWSRTAAIVLCLFGYFHSKAIAKTLQEDTANEGKSAFNIFLFCFLLLDAVLANLAASQFRCCCELSVS